MSRFGGGIKEELYDTIKRLKEESGLPFASFLGMVLFDVLRVLAEDEEEEAE